MTPQTAFQYSPSPLPRRPHPAALYRPIGRLADLAKLSMPSYDEVQAEIVDFALTTRLHGKRLADTWSWGIIRLPSGRRVHACTTFGMKGSLLMEVLKDVRLTDAEARAVARAFVKGHVREKSRLAGRGMGRN